MSSLDIFLQAVGKPITESTILACILAGIIMAVIYWRRIDVSFYNGFLFSLAFFSVMYITRRFADGIGTAGGYVGLFLLYSLFLGTALITKRIMTWIKIHR